MLYEKVLGLGKARWTDTSNLSHDAWLELRKTGIGGSDAGALMGLNKYATPLSVYLAKKDLANFGGNKATEWGNILEEPVRQKAREELGVQIEKVPGMFTNIENNFMNANLDGLVFIDGKKEIAGHIVSGLGGHEIKTSRTGDGFTDDEVPDSYYAQVQHYMAVTGLDWFILTVFILDRYEGKHYVIKRNDIFIDDLINTEKYFWNNKILTNTMPAPTGNENELDLVKSLPMAENVELPSEIESFLDEKEKLEVQVKELQKEIDLIKERVLLEMASKSSVDALKTIAHCGQWKISYNTQNRMSVDTMALKADGLYDKYSKESTFKVLRVSKAK